jgi:hypothetical protein
MKTKTCVSGHPSGTMMADFFLPLWQCVYLQFLQHVAASCQCRHALADNRQRCRVNDVVWAGRVCGMSSLAMRV